MNIEVTLRVNTVGIGFFSNPLFCDSIPIITEQRLSRKILRMSFKNDLHGY